MSNPMLDISQRAIIIFYACDLFFNIIKLRLQYIRSQWREKNTCQQRLCLHCFYTLDISHLQLCFTQEDCYSEYNLIGLSPPHRHHRERPQTLTISAFMCTDCTLHTPISQICLRTPFVVKGVILAGNARLPLSQCDLWWYGLLRCPQLCDCSNEAIKRAAWNKAGTRWS